MGVLEVYIKLTEIEVNIYSLFENISYFLYIKASINYVIIRKKDILWVH